MCISINCVPLLSAWDLLCVLSKQLQSGPVLGRLVSLLIFIMQGLVSCFPYGFVYAMPHPKSGNTYLNFQPGCLPLGVRTVSPCYRSVRKIRQYLVHLFCQCHLFQVCSESKWTKKYRRISPPFPVCLSLHLHVYPHLVYLMLIALLVSDLQCVSAYG